jgi:hypothetical protein
MHPTDVFLKNTQEVLGPLHTATAYHRLSKLEFLTEDRSLRRATYGQGESATRVIVSFASTPASVTSTLGGDVILPALGFVVESPGFAAFHATRWNGQEYEKGALFTLHPTDGRILKDSKKIRVFHAFGPTQLKWKGSLYEVKREQIIECK